MTTPAGTLHYLLVVADPSAITPYDPSSTALPSAEHYVITSQRRGFHPWIADDGTGRPDIQIGGQKLELPLGRTIDAEVVVRVIDAPAPITAVTCDIGSVLIPEGDTDLHLDNTAFSSGMWTIESDAPLTSAPAIHWSVNSEGPQLGTFALFGWADAGDWVRSTWITAVLDGTEGGGAAWTPGQIVGFRFRVNWTLDTGGGNVFVEIEGQPGATRVSGPTPSFNFWDMPTDPLNNQVDLTVFTRADASGLVTVRIGAENMFPSFNLVVGFTDLEVVSCTEGLVSIDAERYTTASLADADARQKQLGRPYYLKASTDGGVTFDELLYAGYLKQEQMPLSLTWLLTGGDAGRGRRVSRAWKGLNPVADFGP